MGPEFQVDGLNRFVSTLRRAGADMDDMKDANARVGAIVVSAANTRVPRKSGRLAATIRSARQVRRAVVSAGNSAVPYAGPIHWGWPQRNIEAHPFISEGAQQSEPTWTAEYNRDLQKIVDGIQGT